MTVDGESAQAFPETGQPICTECTLKVPNLQPSTLADTNGQQGARKEDSPFAGAIPEHEVSLAPEGSVNTTFTRKKF